MVYKKIIRPILFSIPPDTIHKIVAGSGEFTSRIPGVSSVVGRSLTVKNPILQTIVDGITFPNPVGLSAGFDKEGIYTGFIHMMGFGHMELGSITNHAYAGNPKPWIRRLPRNKSLVINYGLKSRGVGQFIRQLQKRKPYGPYGISIAKSNDAACVGQAGIEDVASTLRTVAPFGDWHTINLSCPNTSDGTTFMDPGQLDTLCKRLAEVRGEYGITKPWYLKINPDISTTHMDELIEIARRHDVRGFVIGNLMKDTQKAKRLLAFPEEYNEQWNGSLSGSVVREASNNLIQYTYQKTHGSLTIIGCGGIFTAKDAYEKISLGASVVQMITGFVYGGPATIRRINHGLVAMLRANGHTSIASLRGSTK